MRGGESRSSDGREGGGRREVPRERSIRSRPAPPSSFAPILQQPSFTSSPSGYPEDLRAPLDDNNYPDTIREPRSRQPRIARPESPPSSASSTFDLSRVERSLDKSTVGAAGISRRSDYSSSRAPAPTREPGSSRRSANPMSSSSSSRRSRSRSVNRNDRDLQGILTFDFRLSIYQSHI